MLGIGAPAAIGGASIFTDNFVILGQGNDNAATGGGIMFLAGTLSVLGSIPFFIASSSNKQKAMVIRAGVKMELLPRNNFFKISTSQYPALALRVGLR